MYNPLKSEAGNILVVSLVLLFIAAASSSVIYTQSAVTAKASQTPRLRATVAAIEAKIRSAALSPASYVNCDSLDPAAECMFLGDLPSSDPRAAILNKMQIANRDKVAPSDPDFIYEIRPKNLRYYDAATQSFKAEVVYNGKQANLKPTSIELNVPIEILQSIEFDCPAATPLFQGFNAAGKAICVAIPNTVCPDGQYIEQLTPGSIVPVCKNIPNVNYAGGAACTVNEFINDFSWSLGNQINASCGTRPNPFTALNFTPSTNTQAVNFSVTTSGPFNPQPADVVVCNPTPPPPPVVDCDGAWGPCSTTAPYEQVFSVTVSPANGGAACPAPLTRACAPPPPVNCVGSWSVCTTSAPYQRVFTVVTASAFGGTPCPVSPEACAPPPPPLLPPGSSLADVSLGTNYCVCNGNWGDPIPGITTTLPEPTCASGVKRYVSLLAIGMESGLPFTCSNNTAICADAMETKNSVELFSQWQCQ